MSRLATVLGLAIYFLTFEAAFANIIGVVVRTAAEHPEFSEIQLTVKGSLAAGQAVEIRRQGKRLGSALVVRQRDDRAVVECDGFSAKPRDLVSLPENSPAKATDEPETTESAGPPRDLNGVIGQFVDIDGSKYKVLELSKARRHWGIERMRVVPASAVAVRNRAAQNPSSVNRTEHACPECRQKSKSCKFCRGTGFISGEASSKREYLESIRSVNASEINQLRLPGGFVLEYDPHRRVLTDRNTAAEGRRLYQQERARLAAERERCAQEEQKRLAKERRIREIAEKREAKIRQQQIAQAERKRRLASARNRIAMVIVAHWYANTRKVSVNDVLDGRGPPAQPTVGEQLVNALAIEYRNRQIDAALLELFPKLSEDERLVAKTVIVLYLDNKADMENLEREVVKSWFIKEIKKRAEDNQAYLLAHTIELADFLADIHERVTD